MGLLQVGDGVPRLGEGGDPAMDRRRVILQEHALDCAAGVVGGVGVLQDSDKVEFASWVHHAAVGSVEPRPAVVLELEGVVDVLIAVRLHHKRVDGLQGDARTGAGNVCLGCGAVVDVGIVDAVVVTAPGREIIGLVPLLAD